MYFSIDKTENSISYNFGDVYETDRGVFERRFTSPIFNYIETDISITKKESCDSSLFLAVLAKSKAQEILHMCASRLEAPESAEPTAPSDTVPS